MAASQDNSVLFSLAALQDLHEVRVREELEAEERRVLEARRLREEVLRKQAVFAEEKARLEAALRAKVEADQRAEVARLEAIRLAAVERARVEAQTAARLAMMREAEAHELSLARLREDAQKKRLKRALVTSVISAVALIGGGMGLYFGKMKPEIEARLANQSAELNAMEQNLAQMDNRLARSGKTIETATAELSTIQSSQNELKAASGVEVKKPPVRGLSTNSTNKQNVGNKSTSSCLPGEPGCDLNGNRIF